MNYRVAWKTAARDELAAIWLDADSSTRKAITTACHSFEKQVSHAPYDVGESRDDSERIAFESPLIVSSDVVEAKRLVRVLNVRAK